MPQLREKVGVKKYFKPREVYSLTEQEKDKLKSALADMYKSWPNVDDPVIRAERVIQRCCLATKDDGKPWLNAPAGFADRVKFFGFDYDKMKPIDGFYEAQAANLSAPQVRATKAIPKELKVADPKTAVGSSSFLNSGESKEAAKKLKQMLKDFPELDNKTDQETAMLLAKFYVIADRVMNHALDKGTLPKSTNFDMILGSNIERFQRLLGIDRPSRQKAKMETEEGTVAQLVKDYEEYVQNEFYENEVVWKVEELALLLRKYDREDETGAREIDDVIFNELSGGISVEKARQIVKNPYYDNPEKLMAQLKAAAQEEKKDHEKEAHELRTLYFDVPKRRRKSFKKLLEVEGWDKQEIKLICTPKKKLANLAKKKNEDISK